MKIWKPRSKEDQTPTGKAQETTREKKVCDLERERRCTEETWVDPHDWKLQTQSERELANNKFRRTNDEGSDDLRLKNQSVTRQKKGVTNRGVVYNEVRDKHSGSTFSHLHGNDDTEQENIERDPQLKDLSQSCPGDDDEPDVQMQVENRLHPIEESAETVLCNLLRNTARQVMQESDLHQPIRGGASLGIWQWNTN